MGGSKGGGSKGGGSKRKGPTKGQQKLASMGRAPKSYLGKTKAQQMATNRKVSGIGPVASGSAYAKSLGTATNQPSKKISGIGPVADGSTYARSLETAKKQRQFGADRLGLGSVSFDPKDSPSAFNYSKIGAGRLLTTGADIFAKPKFMYQGNKLGKAPGLSNFFSPDVGSAMSYRTGGWFKGIPFTKGDAAGTITRFNVPKDAKLSRSVLGIRQYNLTPTQMKNLGMGLTDDASKFAAKGFKKYATRAVPFVGAVPGVIDSVNRFKNKDYKGSALAFGSAIPGKIGWASLAGLVAYDAMKGQDQTQVASSDTSGLNIGSVDSGETTEGSKTGRTIVTTDKDKNISYDVGGIVKDAFLGTADTLTGNKFDFDNLGRPSDDKTPSQKFETFKKSPLQQAILSKQLGIDANRIINEGGSAAQNLMKNYISQIDSSSAKGIRNPIARLFRDTAGENQTDATAMAGRAMSAFSVDDPNFSNDPNALTKALSFTGIPQLSEENVQDIRHTFDTSVTKDTGIPGKGLTNIPYSQALGFANRITSGKIKDGIEESMNQLNMKGVPTLDDAVALGSQFATNMKTEGTVTQKRMQELDTLYKKYGPGGGQAPTIPSIIKGIGGPRRTSGSGNNLTISGGNNMNTTIPPIPIPLPTTVQPQTGQTPANLAQLQQQAYNRQMAIYGSPNYSPQVRPLTRGVPRSYRSYFNRNYIV